MSKLVGVIPAAGSGTRAYPYTRGLPKCMLEVDGQPNFTRTVAIMRDQLEIEDVVVIVGALGHVIEDRFGDGASLGVNLTYVQNHAVERGLSWSLLLARPHVDDRWCVLLADECYVDSNHDQLRELSWDDSVAVVGFNESDDPEAVRSNYGVVVERGIVRSLVEKPQDPHGKHLGVGTFLFQHEVFAHLAQALEPGAPKPDDPVSVIGRLVAAGRQVRAFPVRGEYVNINTRDAINRANQLVRSRHFDQRTVAIAVIYRNSLDDTLRTAARFAASRRLQQVLIVAPPGTALEARAAAGVGAEIAHSRTANVGDMLRGGLDSLDADILVTTYGDDSFSDGDLPKLLEYLKDVDMVIGTRTTRQLIDQGSNMRGIVRVAHVFLAKFLELVWWNYEPRMTDVGCAYRAMWRSTYRLIRPSLREKGPGAFLEMVLETLSCRRRVVEIPVSFHVRLRGKKEKEQRLRTVVDILRLILRRRFHQR